MDKVVAAMTDVLHPFIEEIEEARKLPNGNVYRIAGEFGPQDAIPGDAVVGAWRINERGEIVGDFVKNPKYDPIKWPSRE